MKKTSVTFVFLSLLIFIQPIQAKSPFGAVKRAVAGYFDELYGNEKIRPFLESDLNRRFEIYDVVTKQKVRDTVKNGILYHCALFGDDSHGVYLLLENDTPKLVTIPEISDLKPVWDYMIRNGFTRDQMDICMNFIMSIYGYEKFNSVH